MRLSRPCYDKPHRCPGWAGGGWKRPKERRCRDGSVHTRPRMVRDAEYGDYEVSDPGTNRWRFGRCNKCDVVTVPFVWRYLDPRYWDSWTRAKLLGKFRDRF